MPSHPRNQQPATEPDVDFTPAPELEEQVEAAAAAEQQGAQPSDAPRASRPAAPPATTRYRVRSGGISGAGGAGYYTGAVLTADQVGDQARVQKLLDRGAIEVVDD